MKFSTRIKDFWDEFKHRKIGMLGLGILTIIVSISVLAPIIAPMDPTRWSDVNYWANNPKGIPPTWAYYIQGKVPIPQLYLEGYKTKLAKISGYPMIQAYLPINYTYTEFPTMVKWRINLTFVGAGAFYEIYLMRPDKRKITLYTGTATTSNASQGWTIIEIDATRHPDVERRIYEWLSSMGLNINKISAAAPIQIAFTDLKFLKKNKLVPLRGEYFFTVRAIAQGKNINITQFKVILGATAYGLLGTDKSGRDLFKGLVWGTPIALLIGVLTSVLGVSIGLLYGVTSGYIGGWSDEAMMRVVDILMSLPKLPVLIVLAIAYRPTIWLIILFLTIFGWMGIARVSRSIALQLKESAFVEAARAIGASRRRIVLVHIIPNIVPYTVAALALGIPDAILTEAALSFLGLGDPSLPTWGAILNQAQTGGALGSGMWWWFIPPGLAIAVVSMAFVFIGYAVDEIVNPRLRRR